MMLRPPTPADRALLPPLLAAVAADGEEALSEHKMIRLGTGAEVHEIVARDESGGRLDVYAQAAWHRPVVPHHGHWAVEVATVTDAPTAAAAVAELVAQFEPDVRWGLWTRRAVEEDAAGILGLEPHRSLHRLEADLPLGGDPLLPPVVVVAGFRSGKDESHWIETNNAAFAGHPENGAVTEEDLQRRFSEPWWEPEGLRMAWTDGRLVGSCWTKLHPDGRGEVYIIGVHPDAQGRGLGTALTLDGLRHLVERHGVTRALLWAEADNHPAIEMYRKLGFDVAATIRWHEPPSRSVQPKR